ncbi:MAG TPA: TolC family protein [Pyrinomonadaceae bacterium]|nr:TolC family protein [Pyrinomonadaceae bacterium]
MRRLIIILLLASMTQTFALGQKKKGGEKKDEIPKLPTPVNLDRSAPTQSPSSPQTLADVKWFEVFNDEKLQELIREALANNYDMREATARINQARAELGLTRADQFPTIAGSTDVTIEGRSRDGAFTIPEPVQRTRGFGSVLLNLLTYEIDIWGRLKKATAAARADLLASEEARKAVTTTLVSDVATSYFNLRELDFELGIAKRTLASRQESLRIIRLRQERGVSNLLELRQAEELVYSAAEVIPALEQSIEQQENFISFLIGKNPSPSYAAAN